MVSRCDIYSLRVVLVMHTLEPPSVRAVLPEKLFIMKQSTIYEFTFSPSRVYANFLRNAFNAHTVVVTPTGVSRIR